VGYLGSGGPIVGDDKEHPVPTYFEGVLAVERRRLAGATVVTASGEVDLATVRRLRWSLDSVAPGWGPLILDLSEVTFFGSVGVSLLLETAQRARACRMDLRLVGADHVLRVLEMIGVRDEFAVHDSLSAALAD
jgi:anti-anti-sigma factor